MVELLAFEVAGCRYAVPVALLQGVTRAVAIAALPKAPPIVEGVINVRGALVPVFDIRQRCGLAPRPLTLDQHFILARVPSRLIAFRVDRALEILAVDATAIESVAAVAPGTEYVVGIARLPGGLLVIYDLERFLAPDESRQLDTALAQGRRVTESTSRGMAQS